jgi:hypothetical protein
MNVILKDKQLYRFLIRRFSIEQLDELVERVQEEMNQDYHRFQMNQNHKPEHVVYDIVREFISWNVSDIVDQGVEQEYWDSYMAYEAPLVYYIKQRLSLD